MSRIRTFPNGGFAIRMTRNPNLWFSYEAGTNIDDAIKDAGARARQYDDDCLDARLEGISVEHLQDRRHRKIRLENRRQLRNLMRETTDETNAPEPVELTGIELLIARRNTEAHFAQYIG